MKNSITEGTIIEDLLSHRIKLENRAIQCMKEAKSFFKDGEWELGLERLKFSVCIVESIILTGNHSIWKDIYKEAGVPPYKNTDAKDKI